MKKLKAFGHPWHLSHQYALAKFPEIEWHWLIQHRRQYGTMPREDFATKYNIKWVDSYEEGKYDFAVLHLDQQCFAPKLWDKGKGSLYRELNEVIQDIPKIVICHGTPYYPEMFPAKNEYGQDCDGLSQDLIEMFHKVTRGNYVIMNSHKAVEQWGKGTCIWHGLDKDEWFDLPKEPRVVTMLSPAGLDKYYDRAFLRGIKDALAEEGIQHTHITVDWQAKSWTDYRDFLGRSLIYLNPTKESPMPRSRTEAMLSGCCVITTPFQDADMFIKHAENGLLITERNPNHVVEMVKYLLNNYKTAIKLGQEGKKTAIEKFNWERYHAEWMQFVNESINDFKKRV